MNIGLGLDLLSPTFGREASCRPVKSPEKRERCWVDSKRKPTMIVRIQEYFGMGMIQQHEQVGHGNQKKPAED